MKLDRNVNSDRGGKYALLKLRLLNNKIRSRADDKKLKAAIKLLKKHQLLHWGDEGHGEQFFVMKYKDVFTAHGLKGYYDAVMAQAHKMISQAVRKDGSISLLDAQDFRELMEYAGEIHEEYLTALKQGFKLPD